MPLRVVTETKELLEEAQEWGMFAWASETNKKRVRSGIESATGILEREVQKAKQSWSKALQEAYRDLGANGCGNASGDLDSGQTVRKLKDLEYAMRQATEQSKLTFAQAERELDAGKARQGAAQARRAIEMHEMVLRLARDEGANPSQTPSRDPSVHRTL